MPGLRNGPIVIVFVIVWEDIPLLHGIQDLHHL